MPSPEAGGDGSRPPGRILALDPGTKRIGLALSDELQRIASPLEVWTRRSEAEDLAHLRRLVEDHEVAELLVGIPYRMDGSESRSTERALAFARTLEAAFPALPLTRRDETLTTWAAQERMAELGVPPKDRKKRVDAFAAACLLEEELGARAPPHDLTEG